MNSDQDWDAIAFIRRSECRKKVMEQLAGSPKCPSDITLPFDRETSNASRALVQLREQGYAELLVDEETMEGRYYGLTEAGESLWEDVQAAEGDA